MIFYINIRIYAVFDRNNYIHSDLRYNCWSVRAGNGG